MRSQRRQRRYEPERLRVQIREESCERTTKLGFEYRASTRGLVDTLLLRSRADGDITGAYVDGTISFFDRTFLFWVFAGLALPFGLGYLIGGTLKWVCGGPGGVFMVVTDRQALRPVRIGAEIASTLGVLDPDQQEWTHAAVTHQHLDEAGHVEEVLPHAAVRRAIHRFAPVLLCLSSFAGVAHAHLHEVRVFPVIGDPFVRLHQRHALDLARRGGLRAGEQIVRALSIVVASSTVGWQQHDVAQRSA